MAVVLKLKLGGATPIRRGQDHFWHVIRTLGRDGASFTTSDVRALSEEDNKGTIPTYLRRLAEAGVIEKVGEQLRNQSYRLLRAPEAPPRVDKDGALARPKSTQQLMWNLMRGPSGREGFTWRDLVALASTDDVEIREVTAKSYIQILRQSGYLLAVQKPGGATPSVWRLKASMNTGPKPPMVLRAKIVWDQNRGAVIGDVIAEEDPT